MTILMPLAYGYLRNDLLPDRDRDRSEGELWTAASVFGYELGTVFHEPDPLDGTLPPAFLDLVQECRRAEARTVLTLHRHLPNMSVCRMILSSILGVRADITIREIEPAAILSSTMTRFGV
jgi:hypothetical protein